MLGSVSLGMRRATVTTTLMAIAIASTSGCKPGATSLLLDISGPSNVVSLTFAVALASGGAVQKTLPVPSAHTLPTRAVIELPDAATEVTIDLTGTTSDTTATPLHTSQQVMSISHHQLTVPMSLGPNDNDDGGVPTGDAVTVAHDLLAPTDFPGLAFDVGGAAPSLVVLAGKYGGLGYHDDTALDARFDTISALALVGTSLYVAEYWSGRFRTIDSGTGVATTVQLKNSVDNMPFTLESPSVMTYDGAGFLYVASWDQTIRKIEIATSKMTLVAGAFETSGTADGAGATARFDHPNGMAFDDTGNLWVVEATHKTLRKIATPGTTPMVTTMPMINGDAAAVADMGMPELQLSSPSCLVFHAGALYLADTSSVRKLDITQMPVVGTQLTANDQFDSATGIAFSGGELYVTDYGLNALWHLPTGMPPVLVGGANTFTDTWLDGTGVGARLQLPAAIVDDGAGALYFGEPYDVRKFVVSTTAITTVAGRGTALGDTDGSTTASLNSPYGIQFDGYDTVFFADSGSQEVRKFEISLGKITTIAGDGDYTFKDGLGKAARFYTPTAVAMDYSGNLYVSDNNNSCIRKIDSATNVTTIVGIPGKERDPADPIVENADGKTVKISRPQGMFFDGDHTLLFCDSGSDIIRAIDLSTPSYKVSTWAGNYKKQGPQDGIGTAAAFDRPAALAHDPARKLLYVAEANSDLVRVIDISNFAAPSVTTLAGVSYVCGMSVGGFDATQFCNPTGIAITPDGDELFVANQDSAVVTRLDLVGKTSKIAVGAFMQDFVRPGLLTQARIAAPTGVAVTPYGLIISSLNENTLLLATGVY